LKNKKFKVNLPPTIKECLLVALSISACTYVLVMCNIPMTRAADDLCRYIVWPVSDFNVGNSLQKLPTPRRDIITFILQYNTLNQYSLVVPQP